MDLICNRSIIIIKFLNKRLNTLRMRNPGIGDESFILYRVLIFYMSGEIRTTDFWETLHDNFICSQSFCQKYVEGKLQKKYFFIFSF